MARGKSEKRLEMGEEAWALYQVDRRRINASRCYESKFKDKFIESENGEVTGICEYGCGETALFRFKNGKFCCSKSHNHCSGFLRGRRKTPNWKNGHPKGMTGMAPWNKGKHLSKKHREKLSISMTDNPKVTGCSPDPDKERLRRKRLSAAMKGNPKAGGYRKGSGRGKQGWYKGVWCDSSWELAWVIYHLDSDIEFYRNWEKFDYEFNGVTCRYIPDFKMADGTFIEIKGREDFDDMDDKNKAKISSFVGPLTVLYGREMKMYIDYAVSTYGKDYIRFYE